MDVLSEALTHRSRVSVGLAASARYFLATRHADFRALLKSVYASRIVSPEKYFR